LTKIDTMPMVMPDGITAREIMAQCLSVIQHLSIELLIPTRQIQVMPLINFHVRGRDQLARQTRGKHLLGRGIAFDSLVDNSTK
jgi:hypothetical protein